MKTSISPQELKHSLEKGPAEVLVIDVRRRSDFEAQKRLIPGAEWKDPEKVEAWGKDLPKDKPVIVYCVRGGSVSQSVSARLADEQVQVRYLEGGLAAWDLATEAES
jgi:rhodanese-related sulfurtransferase